MERFDPSVLLLASSSRQKGNSWDSYAEPRVGQIRNDPFKSFSSTQHNDVVQRSMPQFRALDGSYFYEADERDAYNFNLRGKYAHENRSYDDRTYDFPTPQSHSYSQQYTISVHDGDFDSFCPVNRGSGDRGVHGNGYSQYNNYMEAETLTPPDSDSPNSAFREAFTDEGVSETSKSMDFGKGGKRKLQMTEKQVYCQRLFERQSRARLTDTFNELAQALPSIEKTSKKSAVISKNAIAATAVTYIQSCNETRDKLKAEREKLLKELLDLREINKTLKTARISFFLSTVEVFDATGEYVYIDQNFSKYMGMKEDTLLQKNMFGMFGQDGTICPPEKRMRMFNSLNATGVWKGTCELLVEGHPDYHHPHEVMAVAMKDESGTIFKIAIFRRVQTLAHVEEVE
eukprot:Colp12_sorted_trinity150504_noHs@18677